MCFITFSLTFVLFIYLCIYIHRDDKQNPNYFLKTYNMEVVWKMGQNDNSSQPKKKYQKKAKFISE